MKFGVRPWLFGSGGIIIEDEDIAISSRYFLCLYLLCDGVLLLVKRILDWSASNPESSNPMGSPFASSSLSLPVFATACFRLLRGFADFSLITLFSFLVASDEQYQK
jgi:hypothetical protein